MGGFTTTPSPGRTTLRSTSTMPMLTSAVQVARAGSGSHPSRAAANSANASATGRLPELYPVSDRRIAACSASAMGSASG